MRLNKLTEIVMAINALRQTQRVQWYRHRPAGGRQHTQPGYTVSCLDPLGRALVMETVDLSRDYTLSYLQVRPQQ